jgi:hypothetical protein
MTPVVPITIPDLDDIRQFAGKLHAVGETWAGEVFGWSAEYNPERPEPPLDSNMTFTPADFSIGESGIWFFSMMWEHGRSNDPVEYLDDRNILRGEPFMVLIEHSRTRQKAQGGISSAKMHRRLGVG